MGKREKKIKKNMMAASNSDLNEKSAMMIEIKAKIAEYKEKGQYEDALTVIIDAFDKGCIDNELISETAKIYYAVGDYKRTVVWAKKLLAFDAHDIEGQLLLAKVYALQDEMNDCFSIVEKLIKGHREISAEICSEIDDLLSYFADDYDEDDLLDRYPAILEFLRSSTTEEMITEPVMNEYHEKVDEVADANESQQDEYACLKGKSVDEVTAAIMKQSVSLVEKVDLCLQFAVYYYTQKDMVKTLMLLKQALLIDGSNTLVLKNVGFILAEMGEKAGALEILSKIKEKDLMILKQIELLDNK